MVEERVSLHPLADCPRLRSQPGGGLCSATCRARILAACVCRECWVGRAKLLGFAVFERYGGALPCLESRNRRFLTLVFRAWNIRHTVTISDADRYKNRYSGLKKAKPTIAGRLR
jgi:hypothetical protein